MKRWKNWKWKEKRYENEQRTFFFNCFSLFETTKICLGCTKMDNFYWGNHISHREKIGKTDFAPSEKYFSYAPDTPPLRALADHMTLLLLLVK